MQEAIRRFIINDRKGFFPSPGQIIGIIEQLIIEEEEERERIESEEYWKSYQKTQERIESGENCATCRFGERREEKYFVTFTKEDVREVFYCHNPESDNSVSQRRCGMAYLAVCEFYEKRGQIE